MRKIPKYIWNDLRLDDENRRSLASMCFYLGKGTEETRRIIDGFRPLEAREIKGMAEFAGYTKDKDELCQ